MNNTIAVIISYKDTQALLKTTLAINGQVDEVVIVDNGSGVEFEEALIEIEQIKNVQCIRLNENLGIAKALNIGVSYAQKKEASWILTMDQDSIADKNMVANLIKTAQSQKDVGIVAALIDKTGTVSNITELDVAITSGNLVNTKVFENVLYNNEYFIDSVDFDFSLKVRDAGWKILQSTDALLAHRLGIINKVKFLGLDFNYVLHSPLRRYYIFRNHIFLIRDHFNKHPYFLIKKTIFLAKIFFAILIFDQARAENIKMISKGIVDGFKNKFGAF